MVTGMEKSRNISYIPHAAACFGGIFLPRWNIHGRFTFQDNKRWKKDKGCFLKAHLGMFKMHLVFGFIDFYSLKRGFSISRDDTRIVQPNWRAARFVAGYLINPALIFLGYWRKTCWAVDFLFGGRRNWLSHTAALLQVLRVPLPRVLSSAARATARCLGTATVTECAPLINHENSNGTVTEPWNGSSELLQDVQGSLLMLPCEYQLQALWLWAQRYLQ